MDKRVKMLDKYQDENKKYHLIDEYRGITSQELPETKSLFEVNTKLNTMLYNKQVHLLFNKTV